MAITLTETLFYYLEVHLYESCSILIHISNRWCPIKTKTVIWITSCLFNTLHFIMKEYTFIA